MSAPTGPTSVQPDQQGMSYCSWNLSPGSTLRVNGRAQVSADPDLLNSFKFDGKAPRKIVVVPDRLVNLVA